MTQTKLEIIGPYTPEYEGPFSFNGEKCLVHGTLGTQVFISRPESDKGFIVNTFDIRNVREVPVAREFWVVGGLMFKDEKEARRIHANAMTRSELIHVREVLPGDGE
ncbi:hypothetical protein D3W54_14645 [Komagataeibacter medellinensis]|uniref:Uncharacterized protein n=1 Tax=Komagataeibacter medellinensis TaxID=1177712 RepID=A0ABQ6VRF6_9PROT|nr:hypothetical protein [Komagataeibacter medellinensis]KAB8122427.1 hypothetical protein D3W54_14645 [Komagataeibacter medellinensis]